jgi:hypothetical protein
MTLFTDLTTYTYGAADSSDVSARNIGWLASGVNFQTAPPDPQFVERLWRFCKISVGQTRGLHVCEMCGSRESNAVRRNEEELLLGSAEIRVVGIQGQLYAAPNLIYHYVVVHNYSPPAEFVDAVLTGPCPPDDRYFELLSKLGLTWEPTLAPDKAVKSFRFVKTSEGVVRLEDE